jgi:hypothetical protein
MSIMKRKYIVIIPIIIIIIVIIFFVKSITVDTFDNNWYNKIDGIVYINLENREDRKKLILDELSKIETDMTKVNKVSGLYIPKNGHKGCVQSHITAINIAKMNKWKYALIFEDDMELNVTPDEFNNNINEALDYLSNKNIDWDILMLATANAQKTKINDIISKVMEATTSSSYIIRDKYYDKLLELFNNCNDNMSREKWGGGSDWEPYALDQQWKKLQKTDNWYCFNTDLIKQRNIRSTIMNRE